MAIKSSNQITFTEHKKIIQIKEYYLATSSGEGITTETNGWTESVQNIDHTKKYLWNYEEVVYSLGPPEKSEPAIIGVYGDSGAAATVAFLTNENITFSADSQGKVSETTFSTNVVVCSGSSKVDATLGAVTGLPSGISLISTETVDKEKKITFKVSDGVTLGGTLNGTINIPITSPINTTLVLTWNKVNNGADGVDGEVQKNITLSASSHVVKVDNQGNITPSTITITPSLQGFTDESFKWRFSWSNDKWDSGPPYRKATEEDDVTETNPYVYTLLKNGVEVSYISCIPVAQWINQPYTLDTLQNLTIDCAMLLNNSTSDYLSIKLSCDEDGKHYEDIITIHKVSDGKGIAQIDNYYKITSDTTPPAIDDTWATTAPLLTPTERFLWNYEVVTYTDGSTTKTERAIIGVYGDSGSGIITFEIYSTQGFQFKEELESIELKVVAFDGNEPITNATYTWQWNDSENGYVDIQTTSSQSFTVNKTDSYATSDLRCVMNYNGKTHEDYVTLMTEAVFYNAVVKFFGGSNIFTAEDPYIVAYVDLYRNNRLIEGVSLDSSLSYCTGISSLASDGTITANIDGTFAEGDKMYFIYKVNDDGLYQAVLGEYSSNVWKSVANSTTYTYNNTLYPNITSNVLAISKEHINKSQNIDFNIYHNNLHITSTNVMVVDGNDPIVSSEAPTNPIYNQLWLDTSITPYVLKMFTKIDGEDAGKWVECSEKLGGAVFTSQPSRYFEGDLWILADNETCGDYGPGSMLKATTSSNTFNTTHWIDADEDATSLKKNIKQYFSFDPNTGLKIGQTNNKFYVNISGTEMGFYDNQQGQNQKVVKISNSSATIQNAKLKGDTDFYGPINICNPGSNPDDSTPDTLFVWQIEDNKSLSLVIPN